MHPLRVWSRGACVRSSQTVVSASLVVLRHRSSDESHSETLVARLWLPPPASASSWSWAWVSRAGGPALCVVPVRLCLVLLQACPMRLCALLNLQLPYLVWTSESVVWLGSAPGLSLESRSSCPLSVHTWFEFATGRVPRVAAQRSPRRPPVFGAEPSVVLLVLCPHCRAADHETCCGRR